MENDFTKRKDQKQQLCYCGKKSTIQLGLTSLPYINAPLLFVAIFIIINALLSATSLQSKVIFIGIACLFFFSLPAYTYFSNKKKMLAAQHTKSCSRHIALLSILYIGGWSFFAILDGKK